MGRWEPDAGGRLQQAAMVLFSERGYASVTVAEIAAQAGVTKRTFFNHFSDKREVLFSGAAELERIAVAGVHSADERLEPIQAALQGLVQAGLTLARYGQYAQARRELIASSQELQERELIKTAALIAAISGALRERHLTDRAANLVAIVAVAVFNTAYTDWVDTAAGDFEALVQAAFADLRAAVGFA